MCYFPLPSKYKKKYDFVTMCSYCSVTEKTVTVNCFQSKKNDTKQNLWRILMKKHCKVEWKPW